MPCPRNITRTPSNQKQCLNSFLSLVTVLLWCCVLVYICLRLLARDGETGSFVVPLKWTINYVVAFYNRSVALQVSVNKMLGDTSVSASVVHFTLPLHKDLGLSAPVLCTSCSGHSLPVSESAGGRGSGDFRRWGRGGSSRIQTLFRFCLISGDHAHIVSCEGK